MKKLIVIADWAKDPVYLQSLRTIVEGFIENPQRIRLESVPVTSSSRHAAFVLQHISQQEEELGVPLETIILQDISITHDFDSLYVLRLKSGLMILSTNIEYSLSMVKQNVDVIQQYSNIEQKQFTSPLALLGRAASLFLDYKEDDLELDEAHTGLIQEVQNHFVGHIDSFGNIITTLTHEDLRGKYSFSDEVTFHIGSTKTISAQYLKEYRESESPILIESLFGLPHSRYLMVVGDFIHKIHPGDTLSIDT
ncbi:hypothetical protein KC726_05865 [Candidatus Woesebacteria bacterium]|nr:hypothetical protein [Candidatus Woesebacteria bacterium]